MKKIFVISGAIFIAVMVAGYFGGAQVIVGNYPVAFTTVNPNGNSCSQNYPVTQLVPNGTIYTCQNGTVAQVSGGGGGTPGGSNTQIQYNNSGAFGGVADVTSDGTNMTVASGGTLTIASGATLTCAGGSTCPASGSTGSLTGSGLTTGDVYYMSGTGLAVADSSVAASAKMPGICVASSSTVCVYSGVVTTGSWTQGAIIYVGSAGALTATAPSTSGYSVQRIGIATTTTTVLVKSVDVGVIQ